ALLQADDLRRRMGAESRRRALRFGWAALATRYLELCARVMAPATAARPAAGRSIADAGGGWQREPRA
ncbi:MAG: hypothetical protein WBC46_19780, partial [Nitrospira sp.]